MKFSGFFFICNILNEVSAEKQEDVRLVLVQSIIRFYNIYLNCKLMLGDIEIGF